MSRFPGQAQEPGAASRRRMASRTPSARTRSGRSSRSSARHMRDLGTPTQGRRLFEAIAGRVPASRLVRLRLARRPADRGGGGFRWGGEFEMTWASALSEFNRTSANMGLYGRSWSGPLPSGCTRFNFGRCTPGSGTHRYKLQWGGRDEPLWWYQRAARGGIAATPSPDHGAWSWGPSIWQKLPVPLATALGPRVVRFIP